MLEKASAASGYPKEQLFLGANGVWLRDQPVEKLAVTYKQLSDENKDLSIRVETQFDFPTTPDAIPGGHFLYSFAAVAVKVEVDLLTGTVKVINIYEAVSAGPVVNPIGYLGQIEGGSIMALGYTLIKKKHR